MFSRFFIQRPIFACVISIIIMLVGAAAIPSLPIEQTPNITPPTIVVAARYPGASAAVLAETVAVPIEQEINGVEGMLYMSSKCSSNGELEVTVTFEVGTDIDMATVLVQNRVAVAEPKLPDEVKREGITVKKKSTNIILMVNLMSPDGRYDDLYLSNYVTLRVKDTLGRIPGVGEVVMFGGRDYGMRIWLDPDKLRSRELTTTDVLEAIQEQNVQVAAGQIGAPPSPRGQQFQYTVNTLGRLSDVEQFENLIVKVGEDARLVRIKDIARVELGAQTYDVYTELNAKPTVTCAIYQLPGANALDVADVIRSTMDDLAKSFPQGMQYDIVFDTTTFITASIDEVISTLLIAVVLVVLTVYVFLQDIRITIIPSVTIPVALIGTFSVMAILGLSINTLTLFGLVLAIGIVVDDAIVVVENTMRLINEEGMAAKEATAKAMEEVSGPVIATTMVLLAVFVPTAMMGGITGRLYQQFSLTIATATVFSSINALTLSPALCGMLLRPTDTTKQAWFFRLFNRVFDASTNVYMSIVGAFIRRAGFAAVMFIGFVTLTVLGFKAVPAGFIPNEDQGYVLVQTNLPNGATLERTKATVDRVTELASSTPGIADVVTIGGFSMLDGLNTTKSATCFLPLKPWSERTTPETSVRGIISGLRQRFVDLHEGIVLPLTPPPIMGLGAAGGFEFQLQDRGGAGTNLLATIGQDLVYQGNQNNPVLTRMNSGLSAGSPQLYLEVDRTKAKTLGVPLTSIFTTLQTFLGSAYVNDFTLFGRTYKVMMQADHRFRKSVEDIDRLQVRDRQGQMIPLSTLVNVTDSAGPQTLFRYNLYPSSTITGSALPGFSSGESIKAMEDLASHVLPSSLGYEWSGITYQQLKTGNEAIFIFGLAIIFVYLFLAAQYESWGIPFAVILAVPMALLGGIGATWLRSFDNNVYTQIGFVLLIGLASKTAILLVEFAKQLHEEGQSIVDAAKNAARLRFRAILMTAFSFILGVIPLVVASGAGSASRQALGTVVCGGMTAATILGVLLIPVLYVIVQSIIERFSGPATNPESSSLRR
jgi:HAE1 family hydrophobic/amphiphilic exporter-1